MDKQTCKSMAAYAKSVFHADWAHLRIDTWDFHYLGKEYTVTVSYGADWIDSKHKCREAIKTEHDHEILDELNRYSILLRRF